MDLKKFKDLFWEDFSKLCRLMEILRGTPEIPGINSLKYLYDEYFGLYYVEVTIGPNENIMDGAELNLLQSVACVLREHRDFKVFTAVEAVEGKLVFRYTFEEPDL